MEVTTDQQIRKPQHQQMGVFSLGQASAVMLAFSVKCSKTRKGQIWYKEIIGFLLPPYHGIYFNPLLWSELQSCNLHHGS